MSTDGRENYNHTRFIETMASCDQCRIEGKKLYYYQ